MKIPRVIRRSKEAITKQNIVDVINACSEIRLKTYVMLLVSTGCRATEGLSIRLCDCFLDINPAKVLIRGEFTKTKTDRFIYLTNEMVRQLRSWIDYKYRPRRICYYDKSGKAIGEYRVPERDNYDLIFSSNRVWLARAHRTPSLPSLYHVMAHSFAKTLDRMGRGDREEDKSGGRRKITLHTFRRWVKSTISDLGFADFSESYIGHATASTYYRKTEKEKEEIFRKLEPSLTFLDFPSLERKGADLQSKIDILESENQALRLDNVANMDAITIVTDKLSHLTEEIEALKKQK